MSYRTGAPQVPNQRSGRSRSRSGVVGVLRLRSGERLLRLVVQLSTMRAGAAEESRRPCGVNPRLIRRSLLGLDGLTVELDLV